MPPKSALSGLEQEVMDVIWSHGKVTAADIQTALTPRHPLRDSTIRTILTRLEEKDYVTHEVDSRTFVYTSVEPPNSVAARAVKQIVDRFCQGSLESLLVGMVDEEIVNPAELEQIMNRLGAQRPARLHKLPKAKERPK